MKKIISLLLLTATLALPFNTASAQEPSASASDELMSLIGKAIIEETTQANEDLKKAKEILDVVLKEGTTAEQQQAEKDVEEAAVKYEDAEKKLDTARTDAFAVQCGKSSAEIQAMRNSGMGWGKIAKECGIHASAAGKGKGKDKNKDKHKNKGKGKKK